jgi:histidinol phosphatase-like PHP family hydrolase
MLCDFHIHTSSSDGDLPVRDVIDLFGREGFDAVAITDHVVDAGTRAGFEAGGGRPWWVSEEQFTGYLRTLWAEARRAWEKYSMLVIPSIEITNETAGYEILALDIKEYVDPSLPVEAIVQGIHDQGGIAIASHPHRAPVPGRTHPRFLWAGTSSTPSCSTHGRSRIVTTCSM